MTEPTTALAVPAPDALPEKPSKPEKSLIKDLAAAAGIDPGNFFAAVQVAAGCKNATKEHFMVLLMQAEKYGLDPLSSPPQLQLLDVGNGPQVYARLDAYKAFLHRAEAAGKIEWRKYEDGWFPDPSVSPQSKERPLARAGKVTMKLRGVPEPVEKYVWLREWAGKGQWATRPAHMLEARAWKEACRDNLGFFVYDMDDAENMRTIDAPKQADAEVREARPVVPIAGIRPPGKPEFAPPPADLEEPQGQVTASATHDGDEASQTSPPAPAPLDDFDAEESRRLDAELAAEAKKSGELFG